MKLVSSTEMEKSRGEAGFEEVKQHLRSLVDIKVALLIGDSHFTGEDVDIDLGVINM